MTNQIPTLSAQAAVILKEISAARAAYGAGVLLVCPATQSVLLGKRSALSPEPGTWSCFGGTSELDEFPAQTAVREQAEEAGINTDLHELTLLYATNRNGKFPFFTFLSAVTHEVEPHLDLAETQTAGWFRVGNLPKPLHPGFQELVNSAQWSDVVKLLASRDHITRAVGEEPTVKAATSSYGICPICGGPGVGRERRINGDTLCRKGHHWPSDSQP